MVYSNAQTEKKKFKKTLKNDGNILDKINKGEKNELQTCINRLG